MVYKWILTHLTVLALCLALFSAMAEGQRQIHLGTEQGSQQSDWLVSIANEWDVSRHSRETSPKGLQSLTVSQVLGPFPIHAREQHFLSPSFPVNRKCKRFITSKLSDG